MNEAAALGFKKAIVPFVTNSDYSDKKIEVIEVKRLMDAIMACISKE